jgi:predicted phosphoribosyltransferase
VAFSSRAGAGRELGQYLTGLGISPDLVLGLPRGGVVVAAEVARVLHRPLDALVVRKIGHPEHPEFAVGALAEGGVLLLDTPALRQNRVDRAELDGVIAEETKRLRDYELRFHPGGRLELAGRSVLIVDDGLATGATTEAAILSARKQLVGAVFVAAPVASLHAVQRLERVADRVLAMVVDPDFMAVGRYYEDFPQTADEEVVALLSEAAADPREEGDSTGE